jgi:hypothetical protein
MVKTGVLNPRISLPATRSGKVTVECPDHGPMTWRDMAWRCGQCQASVTEADMGRLARWLGGETLGADGGG